MSKVAGTQEAVNAPLIINLAPTGMLPTREQTPHAPLTPQEIIAVAGRCLDLGASMVHLHARATDGSPTADAGIYAEIITGIRNHAPDAVIVTTTSGRSGFSLEQRASTLFLEGAAKPDMASLTTGSVNFPSGASVNDPATIRRLAEIMQERGIRPELEIFDLGMLNYAQVLIDKGLVEPPFYFNIILGNIGSAQVRLSHLAAIIDGLPQQSCWSLGGIGRFQAQANALGVVFGHGVRVGLEDNLWLDAGRTRLASNADLVERVVRQAAACERQIATPAHVRRQLGLAATA
jgi:3-oxoadipate:acetyl-CoA acetyltransferase